MAMINCSECGKEISDKAVACIHCGCPIDTVDVSPDSGIQAGDKIKEINGYTVNIDELIRECNRNDDIMIKRLKSLTGISTSEAKRITGIAFRNRGIRPMGFFEKMTDMSKKCPKCGSSNITFDVMDGGKISTIKGKSKGRGKLTIGEKAKGKSRGKFKEDAASLSLHKSVGLCQDCGKSWMVF